MQKKSKETLDQAMASKIAKVTDGYIKKMSSFNDDAKNMRVTDESIDLVKLNENELVFVESELALYKDDFKRLYKDTNVLFSQTMETPSYLASRAEEISGLNDSLNKHMDDFSERLRSKSKQLVQSKLKEQALTIEAVSPTDNSNEILRLKAVKTAAMSHLDKLNLKLEQLKIEESLKEHMDLIEAKINAPDNKWLQEDKFLLPHFKNEVRRKLADHENVAHRLDEVFPNILAQFKSLAIILNETKQYDDHLQKSESAYNDAVTLIRTPDPENKDKKRQLLAEKISVNTRLRQYVINGLRADNNAEDIIKSVKVDLEKPATINTLGANRDSWGVRLLKVIGSGLTWLNNKNMRGRAELWKPHGAAMKERLDEVINPSKTPKPK